jgi:endonuclease/exonuclease/phosphatase family metal-dependent hydrolase
VVSELQTIWLNEAQTEAQAPAWDGSNYERYAVYAKFKNLVTGNYFWFITTHFDHLGIQARQESAKIIMDLAENLDAPAIATGDFNCFPQLGGQELYQLLCSHSKKMNDSGTITEKLFGVPGSWIGWDYDFYKQKEGYAKYDFIFVHNSIKVLQHGIIDDRIWDSRFNKELYPSDHRPVLSDLLI